MLKSKKLVSLLLAMVMVLSIGYVGVFAEEDPEMESIYVDLSNVFPDESDVPQIEPAISTNYPYTLYPGNFDDGKYTDTFWGPSEGTWFSDFYFNTGTYVGAYFRSAAFSLSKPGDSITVYLYDHDFPSTPLHSFSRTAEPDGNISFAYNYNLGTNRKFFFKFVSNPQAYMSGAYDLSLYR